MTWDGAYAAQQEHIRGSITVGKSADFIVLDQDLLNVNDTDIMSSTVLGTFVDGNVVFIHSDEIKNNPSVAKNADAMHAIRDSPNRHWSVLDPWVFAPMPAHNNINNNNDVNGSADVVKSPDAASSARSVTLADPVFPGVDHSDESMYEKYQYRAISQLKSLKMQHIYENEPYYDENGDITNIDHSHDHHNVPEFGKHTYLSGFRARLAPCVRHAPMMYFLQKENYVCPAVE
jgi:hypothetical protein